MNDDMTRDKLLGCDFALQYEDLSVNSNLIVIGDKGTGKTDKFTLPNARWLSSKATIITDKNLYVMSATQEWREDLKETFPIREYVFDAKNINSFKYNPFTADIGDPVLKIRHLSRSLMSASEGVPQTEAYYCYYVALVCAVYYGVTTELDDLEGLKVTLNIPFKTFRERIKIFMGEGNSTYQKLPSYYKYLRKFVGDAYYDANGDKMLETIRKGLTALTNDEAIRMSRTHDNPLVYLDIATYRMYVNLTDDKYSTTNSLFAIFLDNYYDRQIVFRGESEDVIVPYSHIILDDYDVIPMSPHIKTHIKTAINAGITTTVLSERVDVVKPLFDFINVSMLMGGTSNAENIAFLVDKYGVSADKVDANNKNDSVLIFGIENKDIIVDFKLGQRGIF